MITIVCLMELVGGILAYVYRGKVSFYFHICIFFVSLRLGAHLPIAPRSATKLFNGKKTNRSFSILLCNVSKTCYRDLF